MKISISENKHIWQTNKINITRFNRYIWHFAYFTTNCHTGEIMPGRNKRMWLARVGEVDLVQQGVRRRNQASKPWTLLRVDDRFRRVPETLLSGRQIVRESNLRKCLSNRYFLIFFRTIGRPSGCIPVEIKYVMCHTKRDFVYRRTDL